MERGRGDDTSISFLDKFHIEKGTVLEEYIGKQTAIVIVVDRKLKFETYLFPC